MKREINFKKIGITTKKDIKIKKSFKIVKRIFSEYGATLYAEEGSAEILGLESYKFDKLCKTCDMIVSLGGDGTLISACRRSFPNKIPILGINAGKLGFLTDFLAKNTKKYLREIYNNEFSIEIIPMLEIELIKNNKKIKKIAFNDAVLQRKSVENIVKIDAFVDGKIFNSYYGDGVIVASPSGSTAYNISANGPIVYPLTKVFLLTPICSHSLTQRPLILPSNFSLDLKTDSNAVLVIDGHDVYEMKDYDKVSFKLFEDGVRLLRHKNRNYFKVLRKKLNWGNK